MLRSHRRVKKTLLLVVGITGTGGGVKVETGRTVKEGMCDKVGVTERRQGVYVVKDEWVESRKRIRQRRSLITVGVVLGVE